MEQNSIVTMALAAGGENAEYGPAQAQKLFFLIDKELWQTTVNFKREF